MHLKGSSLIHTMAMVYYHCSFLYSFYCFSFVSSFIFIIKNVIFLTLQWLVYYVNFLLLDVTQWEVHKCLWKMLSTNQLCLHNLKMWLKKNPAHNLAFCQWSLADL